MIKFFRKIRKQLLSENKVNKYLLYAVGEIILVVIGILIALQINNLNEAKKTRAQEVAYLKNIKSDLAATNIEMDQYGASRAQRARAASRIVEH